MSLQPKLVLIFALCLSASAQTIRTTGPRVWATEAEQAVIFSHKTGTPAQQAVYNETAVWVTSYCGPSATSTDCVQPIATMYKLDPTAWAGYLDKGCTLLDKMTNPTDGIVGALDSDSLIGNGNSFRWNGPSIARSYDALHGHCGALDSTITTSMRWIVDHAWAIYNKTTGTKKWSAYGSNWRVIGNIGAGEFDAFTQLALVAYDPVDYTLPQTTYLPEVLGLLRTLLLPCLANSTANYATTEICYGGAWPEGMSEYGPEAARYVIEAIDNWRIGTTDVDLWPELGTDFPKYTADWLLKGTSPTGVAGTYWTLYQPYLYRDVEAAGSNRYYGYLYKDWRMLAGYLRAHFERVGDTDYKNYLQYFSKTIMPVAYMSNPLASGFTIGEFMIRLRTEDADSSGVDYRGPLGLDHLTPFMMLSRSDWTSTATWGGFQALLEGSDHAHGDAGQFQIYRKGKWLTREIPGYIYSSERYMLANAAHNSLTLNGHGSKSAGSRLGTLADAILPRMTRTASGYKSVCRAGYCASEATLGPAYRFSGYAITPDVTSVVRNWLYLKPDITVVSDRIQYVSGLNAMTVAHIQSEKGAAVLSGNRATIANATQRLHVTAFSAAGVIYNPVHQNVCRILDAVKASDAIADVYLDCNHTLSGSTNVLTVSGLTGEWAALNGTLNAAIPTINRITTPYQDGIAYNIERLRVTSTTPNFLAGVTTAFPVTLSGIGATNLAKANTWNDPDVNPSSPGTLVYHDPYRLDLVLGTKANSHSLITVMQSADDTDTPLDVTDMSLTADAATFTVGSQRYIVASPRTYPVALPITYYVGVGAARHLVMGLPANTLYSATVADGIATISASTGINQYTTDAAGVLEFGAASSVTLPIIATTTVPDGVVGTSYLQLLAATDGTPPYTWTVSSGTLPAGLSLSTAGQISGTPTSAATSSFTVLVTDAAANTDSQALSLTVTAPGGTVTGTVTPSVWLRRGTSAIVRIDGVKDAAQTCVVDAIQGATVVSSGVDADTLPIRYVPLLNLDPTQIYTLRATCGANIPQGQVDSGLVDSPATTAVAGTRSVPLDFSCSADMTLKYGLSLGTSVSLTHSAGRCTASPLSLPVGVASAFQLCRGAVCTGPLYLIP